MKRPSLTVRRPIALGKVPDILVLHVGEILECLEPFKAKAVSDVDSFKPDPLKGNVDSIVNDTCPSALRPG
jgi:hypothetical protein